MGDSGGRHCANTDMFGRGCALSLTQSWPLRKEWLNDSMAAGKVVARLHTTPSQLDVLHEVQACTSTPRVITSWVNKVHGLRITTECTAWWMFNGHINQQCSSLTHHTLMWWPNLSPCKQLFCCLTPRRLSVQHHHCCRCCCRSHLGLPQEWGSLLAILQLRQAPCRLSRNSSNNSSTSSHSSNSNNNNSSNTIV